MHWRPSSYLRAKATASACNFAVALGQKILNLFASDGRRSRRRRPSAASRHARPRARSLSPQRRSRAPCASFPSLPGTDRFQRPSTLPCVTIERRFLFFLTTHSAAPRSTRTSGRGRRCCATRRRALLRRRQTSGVLHDETTRTKPWRSGGIISGLPAATFASGR